MQISYNEFTGRIPPELKSLSNLEDGGSDFRSNHLFSDDEELTVFLNQKQGGDWESSQIFALETPLVEPLGVCGVYELETPCHPFIQEAINFSAPPAVIYIAEGDYHENVTIEIGRAHV